MTAHEFDGWAVHSVDGFVRQQVEAGLQPEDEARRDAVRIFAEQVPDGLATPDQHFLRVEETGTDQPVGHVWLRVRRSATEVEGYLFDVELREAARGRGLGRATLQATHDLARSLGATVMRLNVFGTNGPAIGLYESLGYAVAAATMHRRLDDLPPLDGPSVELRDMTPAEYAVFRPHLEQDYAANIAASGARSEVEARAQATDDLDRLLPDGLATPGHRLWTAYDGSVAVGVLWVQLQDRSDGLHAFGYELEVREDLRRRGYGRAVVGGAFRACRDLGVQSVGLSVFGFNAGARALYEELGFRLTAQTMVLAL
jgi:ribosomal protein S18 acetylase RimI-like enzyme